MTLFEHRYSDGLSRKVLEDVEDGEILTVRGATQLDEIADFTKRYVGDRAKTLFATPDTAPLDCIHTKLSATQIRQLWRSVQADERGVKAVPIAIAKMLEAAGLSDSVLMETSVHFRMVAPITDNGNLGVPAHRDSWYSLPRRGVNIWIPCTRHANNGVALVPQFFRTHLKVGRKDPVTNNQRTLGIDLSKEPFLAPPYEVGECLLFAGDHLHYSEPNRGDQTRVSWDYRVVEESVVSPFLRIYEFVYADLFLQRPDDHQWQQRQTRRRLVRRGKALSALMHGVGSMSSRIIVGARRLIEIWPRAFFR